MNKEIIKTIKNVKTSEELKDVASKNGYDLTLEEAKGYFDLYHNNGQVNENELDNVTGGSTCINNKHYSGDDHGYLIVTWGNSCPGYLEKKGNCFASGKNCFHCTFMTNVDSAVSYCKVRTRYDDPYNEKIGTTRTKGESGRYWNEKGDAY